MRDAITALVDAVRLLHNHLVRVAETLHADTGISAPQRAVLEYLQRHGRTSVPDIARARHVTRQHIQTIVNDLLAADLVEPQPNPAHRRSPLFDLTPEGREVIDGMLRREAQHVAERLDDLDEDDVRAATRVLRRLGELL